MLEEPSPDRYGTTMPRTCARPGCSQVARATFTYGYDDSTVWLEALAEDRHPMAHDLCDLHADGFRVPRGWSIEDRRAGLDDPTALAS